jgi:branched-chain amino acid transport system ATP-binding protein
MSDILLHIAALQAGYAGVPVLYAVSLDIAHGEIVTLVGSNGAGKTTLLRALSHLIPSKGSIIFDGRSLERLTADDVFALGLVQVPEGRQLFDHMSVEENLLMGAYRRSDRHAVAADLERMYRLFPAMSEHRRRFAGSMSGGEQQMCAIARGLMAAPKLLMVDEMSLGLAPVVVDSLLDVLSEIRAQGVTVLMVEQDVFSALHVADRGYVMETGKIVRTGSSSELARDPQVQRAYLGV